MAVKKEIDKMCITYSNKLKLKDVMKSIKKKKYF